MKDKIILGTAQFGLDYGINNQNGQIPKKEIFKILDYAMANGINKLDTASAYGSSELIIGEYIKNNKGIEIEISTKIKNNSSNLIIEINKSLEKLNVNYLHEMLFHSINEYFFFEHQLKELLNNNRLFFKKLGVSVYTNEEILKIIDQSNIDVIQFPFNLLDNMNCRGTVIEKLIQNKIEYTFRSVFLQGLFFIPVNKIPKKISYLAPYLLQLKKIIKKNNSNIISLAINYCLSNCDKGIIIGCDSLKQLTEIIDVFDAIEKDLLNDEIEKIKIKDSVLLDPRNW